MGGLKREGRLRGVGDQRVVSVNQRDRYRILLGKIYIFFELYLIIT
jgi:hypothetical protein